MLCVQYNDLHIRMRECVVLVGIGMCMCMCVYTVTAIVCICTCEYHSCINEKV